MNPSLRLLSILVALVALAPGRALAQTAVHVSTDGPAPSPQQPDFDEHLAGDPNTVGNLKWDYEPFPGALFFERSVLASTLAIGLGDRWEVGTVPLFYLVDGNGMVDRNITVKYNFVRNSRLSLAIGYLFHYQQVEIPSFSYTSPDGTSFSQPATREQTLQHGVSLFGAVELTHDFDLGLNVSTTFTRSDEAQLDEVLERMPTPIEEYADLCYHATRVLSVTSGLSHTEYYSTDLAAMDYQYGVGSTVTWHRPQEFLSEPALGIHHLLRTHQNVYLLSTSFY